MLERLTAESSLLPFVEPPEPSEKEVCIASARATQPAGVGTGAAAGPELMHTNPELERIGCSDGRESPRVDDFTGGGGFKSCSGIGTPTVLPNCGSGNLRSSFSRSSTDAPPHWPVMKRRTMRAAKPMTTKLCEKSMAAHSCELQGGVGRQ